MPSRAGDIYYNFSALNLAVLRDAAPVVWDKSKASRASMHALRSKMAFCVYFDVKHNTCSMMEKGGSVCTVPLSDIRGHHLEEDERAARMSITFRTDSGMELFRGCKRLPDGDRLSFELCSPFDRLIIADLVKHAASHDSSISALEDSFPKHLLHHSALQLKGARKYSMRFAVLVKFKLYLFNAWTSKYPTHSLNLMGLTCTVTPHRPAFGALAPCCCPRNAISGLPRGLNPRLRRCIVRRRIRTMC